MNGGGERRGIQAGCITPFTLSNIPSGIREHAAEERSAVGLAELPHGIPVEINGDFELRS